MDKIINIAIDGPAGAGKSSAARLAAKKLGYLYVDTGALYRAVGVGVLRKNRSTEDREQVTVTLNEITVELKFEDNEQKVLLNGEDVSTAIRMPEASMAASNVSKIPAVRAFLFDLQRSIAQSSSCLMDGRDIGTVVLPEARVKIFLTASPEIRAKRRFDELCQKGTPVEYDALLREIKDRDYQDSHREIAPLKPAPDSVILDSSEMTLDQVVAKIVEIVKEAAV